MVSDATKADGLLTLQPADIDKNISTLATAGIKATASDLFTDKILKLA